MNDIGTSDAGAYRRLAILVGVVTLMLISCSRESVEILQRPAAVKAVVNGMKILRESQKSDSLQFVVNALNELLSSRLIESAVLLDADSLDMTHVASEIHRFYDKQGASPNVHQAAIAFSELYRYGRVGYNVIDNGKLINIWFLKYGHNDRSIYVQLFVMDSLARTSIHSTLINDLSVPRTDSLRLFYNTLHWELVERRQLTE